ncbi:MAG: hypothetical protein ACI9UU_001189 [Candidatus Azotimanducaceae bacterium]|jgi:uncharacterized protein with NAD-binding domain and iron-sulfur cluster
MPKKRIAIVGGGPSGLATAFYLTQEPGWDQKYDITVYQMGWRVGGKGATGRDPENSHRIEEHGVHVFCRFYLNTWEMMRETYKAAINGEISHLPTNNIAEAFLPSSTGLSVELLESSWITSDLRTLPRSPGKDPWDWTNGVPPMDKEAAINNLLLELINSVGAVQSNDQRILGKLHELFAKYKLHKIKTLISEPSLQKKMVAAAKLFALIEPAIAKILDAIPRGVILPRQKVHSLLAKVDVLSALLKGLIHEQFWLPTFDIDTLDDQTFREWLKTHGARDSVLARSTTNTIANVLFAHPNGDSTQTAPLSAAAWVSWTLRTFLGQGESMYFFQAGTGESVILPIYKLLKKRGVKFEFFHRLYKVDTNGDKDQITKLHFERQARIMNGEEYDPLCDFHTPRADKNYHVWPNTPNWEQLENGEELKKCCVDFEEWDSTAYVTPEKQRTLSANEDFDFAVWAMPPSMLKEISAEQFPKTWRNAAKLIPTAATQAAQIWLTEDTHKLGWSRDKVVPKDTGRYLSASMPNPLNSLVAFDDLVKEEGWPINRGPNGLIYYVATLQMLPGESRQDATRRVQQSATDALRTLGVFLTDARPEDAGRTGERSIDYNYVYSSNPSLTGEARLSEQYFRANTRPTEAYTQAPRNSVKGRLKPWKSEIKNAIAAGDWVYTGINLGAFESAVTGGRLAAFAISGYGAASDILGFEFLHPNAYAELKRAAQNGPIPLVP